MSQFYAFRVRDREYDLDLLLLSHDEVEEYRDMKDELESDEFCDGSGIKITIVAWSLEDMQKYLMFEDVKEARSGEYVLLRDVPPHERGGGEAPLTHDEHKKSLHRREE